MSNYRITFLRNNLISCKETDQILQDDEHSYYFKDAQSNITCMLVHAQGKDEALKEAVSILEQKKNEAGSPWPATRY
jgi:hypothetical protein